MTIPVPQPRPVQVAQQAIDPNLPDEGSDVQPPGTLLPKHVPARVVWMLCAVATGLLVATAVLG